MSQLTTIQNVPHLEELDRARFLLRRAVHLNTSRSAKVANLHSERFNTWAVPFASKAVVLAAS